MSTKLGPLIKKRLLPSLPGFVARNRLVYELPVGHYLRGFYFEPSGLKDTFYVWKFVQPLSVPRENVSFTYGDRLKLPSMWKLEPGEEEELIQDVNRYIQTEGLPFIRHVGTPEGVVAEAERENNPVRRGEATAHALILLNRLSKADAEISLLLSQLPAPRTAWDHSTRNRLQTIQDFIRTDPGAALRQLTEWEQFTRQALGITEE